MAAQGTGQPGGPSGPLPLPTADIQAFCRALPKVELHAHLNGSIRDETIRDLVHSRGGLASLCEEDLQRLTSSGPRALADCFRLFDVIHQVTTSHDVITRITQEVIEDFDADNCVYLELRTTPKARPEHGMTKRSYVEAVLAGVQQHQQRHPSSSILVRLLLSIDRREGPEAALETVELAAQLRGRGVVGVDLSGNPSVGSWASWLPALQAARDQGLAITLHGGEVPNPEEVAAMLDFAPERLGHMCRMTKELEDRLWASCIPVELCLTSNVLTQSVPGYVDHHFREFYAQAHPVVLCTDDSGVFCTTLSKEYALAAVAFGLSEDALLQLAERAAGYVFGGAEDRRAVRERVAAFRLQWQRHQLRRRQEQQQSEVQVAIAEAQSRTGGCAAALQ